MGLVHTPRVILSTAKGWLRKGSIGKEVGYTKPYKYYARAGLFDVDYMGHMNNASFLSHAELARWEMTAANGFIEAMMKSNIHFVVQSTTARYRAEVRPIFRKFQVDSTVCAVDEKNAWIYAAFRHAEEGDSRVRAQVLCKSAAVYKGKSVDMRNFLKEKVGIDASIIDGLSRPHPDPEIEAMIAHLDDLDIAKKGLAAKDDKENS